MNNSIETEVNPSLPNEVIDYGVETRINLLELINLPEFGQKELDLISAQAEKVKIYKEKEKLKFIFGQKAKIEKNEDGEWLVESILGTRGIVPGGQKINLKLEKETNLEIKEAGYTFYNLYPIKDIKINNEKIKLSSEIFFSPKRDQILSSSCLEETIKKRDTSALGDLIENEIFGGRKGWVTILNRHIILDGFDSAEDLVGLLHECGHLISKNPYKVGGEDYKRVSESISKLSPEEKISDEDINTLLLVFEEENKASNSALTIIKDLRKKGIDLFPEDPNLIYVNLFLAMSLSTFLKNPRNSLNLGKQINNPETFLDFDSSNIK